ncbi:hypothetical protein VTI74DRAFT_11212 [Chaetomium olivicolor]
MWLVTAYFLKEPVRIGNIAMVRFLLAHSCIPESSAKGLALLQKLLPSSGMRAAAAGKAVVRDGVTADGEKGDGEEVVAVVVEEPPVNGQITVSVTPVKPRSTATVTSLAGRANAPTLPASNQGPGRTYQDKPH